MKRTLKIIFCLLLFISSCSEKKLIVPAGTPRDRVYKILGTPSNYDNRYVAVWDNDSPKLKVKWRDIYLSDPIVVVFDEKGVTLVPSYPASANIEIEQELSDEQISDLVQYITDFD